MKENNLRDLIFSLRKNKKDLQNLVIDKVIEKIKNEAYMSALEELRLKYRNLTSGITINPNAVLSNENERSLYQGEYEMLAADNFEKILGKALDKILCLVKSR